MASREELLNSIEPSMRLDKAFFLKVYGYELTWPGFAEDALARLEILGCSRAREYYNRFVSEYEKNHEEQMKNVAKWYREQCEDEYEDKKRKELSECKKKRTKRNNYKSNQKSNFFLISKELGFRLDKKE